MKYVLTDQKDVIIHISDTIGYQSNGNPLVDNGTLAIAKILVEEVYEVSDIPSEVKEAKYCYTSDKGFYINENYREPVKRVTNEEIQNQINDIQLALCELYESKGV